MTNFLPGETAQYRDKPSAEDRPPIKFVFSFEFFVLVGLNFFKFFLKTDMVLGECGCLLVQLNGHLLGSLVRGANKSANCVLL